MSHPGFSGVIRISNVSDFIEPGVKCVLPQVDARVELQAGKNLVGIHKASKTEERKTIKVTLNDCLACSGCITTAETMLVESQTVDQMFEGIRTHKLSVVTVSPQSMSSLAAKLDITPHQLALYLRSIGASYVLDSSFARLLTRRLYYEEFRDVHLSSIAGNAAPERRTILTGVCPGFVCYAEKTHGDLLVPLISRVRSPQAIMGRLVKDYLARRLEIDPNDIFHITVMPCYDKKLEASRGEFRIQPSGCQEVDCVVTASELESIVSEQLASLHSTVSPDEPMPMNGDGCGSEPWLRRLLIGKMMGDSDRESSGGYAEYVAKRLLNELPDASIQREQRRKDMELITISSPHQPRPLRLAKLYGFKNIQNAVQSLKRQRPGMDFVEIMACPSGCANGGGQIRGADIEERRRTCERVIEKYSELEAIDEAEAEMVRLDDEWGRLNPSYREVLFTEYHKLDKSKNLVQQSW